MAQVKPLRSELQKIAIEEMNEVPARIPQDLEALKQWMEQQPHLKYYDNNEFLVQCLRISKYSLEKAKKQLDYLLSFPQEYMVEDVEETKFQRYHNEGAILLLPQPLNDCGPRLFFIRSNFNAQDYAVEEYLRYFLAVHHVMMITDPYACIYGCLYICDFAQCTMDHLLKCNLNFIKEVFVPLAKRSMFRVKSICILNVPAYIEPIAKVVLSCFSEKIRNRILLCYGNSDISKTHVPPKYLPREYGGENGCLQQLIVEQGKLLIEHREYLKDLFEHRSDERLRLGKTSVECDAMAGGSFRKLNVD